MNVPALIVSAGTVIGGAFLLPELGTALVGVANGVYWGAKGVK